MHLVRDSAPVSRLGDHARNADEASVAAITTSLVERGLLDFVGFRADGQPRYRVTPAGFAALRRAQRRP